MDPSGARRILLVEDEAIIAAAQKAALERQGYAVDFVLTGEEAVERCLGEACPDLVLMDIDLGPGLDGPGAARRILGIRPLPIVFLSSHTERELVERTEAVGSYGYVVKNSGITVLDASIKMAFRLFDSNSRLAESEGRYESLYRNMVEGAALHRLLLDGEGRAVDYVIEDVNPAFEALLGLSRERVLGRTSREAYGVEEPPYLALYAEVAQSGEARVFSTYFAAMDRHFTISVYCPRPLWFATVFQDVTERTRMEEALRDSEARFRSIVEGTGAGYFFIDREGRFRDVNEAWLRLHGYEDCEEVLGAHFSMTQPEPDLEAAQAIVERLLAGETPPAGEFPRRRKDGSVGWHLFTLRPVSRAGEVLGLEGFLIDSSARREAEDSLREREGLYRALLSNLLNGYAYCRMEYDEEGRPVDFVYLEVNEAFTAQTGLVEVVGRRVSEVIPGIGERDPWLLETYGRVARTGRPERFELPLAALGEWFRVSVYSPKPGHFVAVFDVTTRERRSSLSLDVVSRRFQELASNFPGYLAFVDAASLRYEYLNGTYQRSFGRSPEELVGSTIREVIGEESFAVALPHIEEARRGRPSSYENSFDLRDGRRWVHIDYLPMPGPGGSTDSLAVIGLDITLLKEAEERVRALLAEKELLLHEVHHRIKNNMGTIRSLLELQAEASPEQATKTALAEASARVDSMLLLYERLYRSESVGRVATGDYLSALADRILADQPVREGLRVDKRIEDLELAPEQALPLGIVLNELISNAMKHAFDGRTGGRLELGFGRVGPSLRLLVADDGPGLPEETAGEGGRGFGLTLVRALARQLGGRLELSRGPGARVGLLFGAPPPDRAAPAGAS